MSERSKPTLIILEERQLGSKILHDTIQALDPEKTKLPCLASFFNGSMQEEQLAQTLNELKRVMSAVPSLRFCLQRNQELVFPTHIKLSWPSPSDPKTPSLMPINHFMALTVGTLANRVTTRLEQYPPILSPVERTTPTSEEKVLVVA